MATDKAREELKLVVCLFSERSQFVVVVPHPQGLHIFQLMQPASRLDALHHVVPFPFRLCVYHVDGSLIYGQEIP